MEIQYQWTELSEHELLPEVELSAIEKMRSSFREVLPVRRDSDASTQSDVSGKKRPMSKLFARIAEKMSDDDSDDESSNAAPWFCQRPVRTQMVPVMHESVADIDLSLVLTN